MITIPLTQGKVALIDDEDAHLADLGWYAHRGARGGWYALRHEGRRVVRLHEAVLGQSGVDHRNGDGLNCRRGNLRPATAAQNAKNRARGRNNTSGFKGVSRATDRDRPNPWHARVMVDRRSVSLGYHATPEEAARAYDAAATKLHGEFARLNFPEVAHG